MNARRRIRQANEVLNHWAQGNLSNFPWLDLNIGCPYAIKDHDKEWRVHAHTICTPYHICCVEELGELPETVIFGILAHEFGHELAMDRWGEKHTEDQANQIVEQALGLRIYFTPQHRLQWLKPSVVSALKRKARQGQSA